MYSCPIRGQIVSLSPKIWVITEGLLLVSPANPTYNYEGFADVTNPSL